jgi:hypothetical protein
MIEVFQSAPGPPLHVCAILTGNERCNPNR